MNLYQINEEILNCVDVETGEIFDIEKFESLNIERDSKIENIALWIKNLKSDIEALKAEKDTFYKRQKSAENKMESLKKYLSEVLEGSKFETSKVKISFRKSEELQIAEGVKVPDEFLKVVESVDKTGLKKAVKDGLSIKGVEIVEKQNIQIK